VQFIVYFGAWFSNVTIYTLILEFRVSPRVNALVVATYSLPAIFLAPLSGSLVDKLAFKKFMIVLMMVEFIMTLSYMLIVDISQVWLLPL
jgi:MFS family permease